MATNKQGFALFTICGVDIRTLNMSVQSASGYIGRAKNGEVAEVRDELLRMGAVDKGEPKQKKPANNWKAVWKGAVEAGKAAAEKTKPTPMLVQQHANQMDDTSPVVKQWFVPSGACGFAWIKFPGNTSFGRWAKKNLNAYPSYRGGMQISIHEYGQSIELKEAFAAAAAKYLQENGVERCYSDSRLD